MAERTLLTVDQVADEAQVHPSTVWRYVQLGKFPKPIKIGSMTRWRRSDLDAFYGDAA